MRAQCRTPLAASTSHNACPPPPPPPVPIPVRSDFNTYHDSMSGKAITAAQNAEYVKFSSQALRAALQRLDSILQLLPAEAVQQAADANRIN